MPTVASKLHVSVEKFMVWIIAICGVHNAVGRKLVLGLENDVLYDVLCYLVLCKYGTELPNGFIATLKKSRFICTNMQESFLKCKAIKVED